MNSKIEVLLSGEWFPARITKMNPENSEIIECITVYSEMAIKHDVICMQLSVPLNRTRRWFEVTLGTKCYKTPNLKKETFYLHSGREIRVVEQTVQGVIRFDRPCHGFAKLATWGRCNLSQIHIPKSVPDPVPQPRKVSMTHLVEEIDSLLLQRFGKSHIVHIIRSHFLHFGAQHVRRQLNLEILDYGDSKPVNVFSNSEGAVMFMSSGKMIVKSTDLKRIIDQGFWVINQIGWRIWLINCRNKYECAQFEDVFYPEVVHSPGYAPVDSAILESSSI